jgi:hypothetical protein
MPLVVAQVLAGIVLKLMFVHLFDMDGATRLSVD